MHNFTIVEALIHFTKQLVIDTVLITIIACGDSIEDPLFNIYRKSTRSEIIATEEALESLELLLNVLIKHEVIYPVVFRDKKEYLVFGNTKQVSFDNPNFIKDIKKDDFKKPEMFVFKKDYDTLTKEHKHRFVIQKTSFASDFYSLN